MWPFASDFRRSRARCRSMRSAHHVCARLLIATLFGIVSTADAQPAARRSLEAALRELQAEGLNIVYSSELVRPEMRVAVEPPPLEPRQRLDALLKPHGLAVRAGPNGALLIVRARALKPKPIDEVAAGAGNIAGRVIDARTGAPLAGVLVAASAPQDGVVTGADGSFAIRGLPA